MSFEMLIRSDLWEIAKLLSENGADNLYLLVKKLFEQKKHYIISTIIQWDFIDLEEILILSLKYKSPPALTNAILKQAPQNIKDWYTNPQTKLI